MDVHGDPMDVTRRSIQMLPNPTPSMVDLYNGMVEASYLMGW